MGLFELKLGDSRSIAPEFLPNAPGKKHVCVIGGGTSGITTTTSIMITTIIIIIIIVIIIIIIINRYHSNERANSIRPYSRML
jgi:uncharacterized membrane protein